MRPHELTEALDGLARGGATVLAGGTDLFATTQAPRLSGPVVDISGIAALQGIARGPEGDWRIGGCTTWAGIAGADLPPAFDALRAAARVVGGRQVQTAGTIGGNLCNASPAADGVPPLLALDAGVDLASAGGMRRLPLAAFLTGPRRTALRPGEVLAAVTVPAAAARGASAFEKLGARAHLVISIVMVAARVELRAGRIAAAALAVGACSGVARRLPAVEAALAGVPAAEAAGRIDAAAVAAALDPLDDIRASAAYRREAAADLLRRAVARAVNQPETEAP